jgi:phosphatidylserine/phosphatidylglycerophosphate/cardiolipin synthase-like enzyme
VLDAAGLPEVESGRAAEEPRSLFEPGRNCECVAHARRAAFLVDSCEYFRRLRQALLAAQRSILIVGWDFDGSMQLEPDRRTEELRDLLVRLVEERPALEIRILVWGLSVLWGPSTEYTPVIGVGWHERPRIYYRYDTEHPIGAAHHQKIVCIDDKVAFVGGIDLTAQRWDTCEHLAAHPLRLDRLGRAYRPVHDIVMAVDGEAARAVSNVVRERWRRAIGDEIPTVEHAGDPWPEGLEPDLRDARVAVSRTLPDCERGPRACEVVELNLDLIAAARECLYLETQYLTADDIGQALRARLDEPEGPEIVIVMRKRNDGWLEHFAMGNNRDRLVRRLRKSPGAARLRCFYAVSPREDDGEQEIDVHSKAIVVDDRAARVGSSNLNNRSHGLDSECDLAVEARDETQRRAIRGFRNRLVAEHLGRPVEELERAIAECGGLIGAIDRLNTGPRKLRELATEIEDGPDEPLPGSAILDPREPIDLLYLYDATVGALR